MTTPSLLFSNGASIHPHGRQVIVLVIRGCLPLAYTGGGRVALVRYINSCQVAIQQGALEVHFDICSPADLPLLQQRADLVARDDLRDDWADLINTLYKQ